VTDCAVDGRENFREIGVSITRTDSHCSLRWFSINHIFAPVGGDIKDLRATRCPAVTEITSAIAFSRNT